MLLSFTLSMPNTNSWNGQWSGEGRRYVIYRSFTSKKDKENAAAILAKGYFYYNFGDGWGAGVSVQQATKRTKSDGFCGYDWMVDSIISHGSILNSNQIKEQSNV